MATNERPISSHSKEEETTDDIYNQGTLDPIYQRKAHILNDAIQDIGMGKYQVFLIKNCLPFDCHLIRVCSVGFVCSYRFWLAFVSLCLFLYDVDTI